MSKLKVIIFLITSALIFGHCILIFAQSSKFIDASGNPLENVQVLEDLSSSSTKWYLAFHRGFNTIISQKPFKGTTKLDTLEIAYIIDKRGMKVPVAVPSIEVSVTLQNRDSCDVYIENWNTMTTITNGDIRFNLTPYIFSSAPDGVVVWLTGNDFYYPHIDTIKFHPEQILLGKIEFSRRPVSRIHVLVDAFGSSLNGRLESSRLTFRGNLLNEPEIKQGSFTAVIDHPIDNSLQLRYVNEELKLDTIVAVYLDPRLVDHTVHLFPYNIADRLKRIKQIELEKKRSVRLIIQVSDSNGPIDGQIESDDLVYYAKDIADLQLRNGHYENTVDRPPDSTLTLRFFKPGFDIGNFKVDTTLVVFIHPDSMEKHVKIYFPYSIAQRRAEEERLRRGKEDRTPPLAKQKTVRAQLVGEYLRRQPNSNFTQQLQRPESNFTSFPQISAALDVANLFKPKMHLRTKISLPAISGIGIGVSLSPIFTLVKTENFGFNGYLGGAYSNHGAKLDNNSNGFREGFAGIQIGFGSTESKITPGKFFIDVQGFWQGFPYINLANKYKVKSITGLKVGGELVINKKNQNLPFGSVAFHYSFDNLFDYNFAVAFKFHLIEFRI